MRGGIEDVVSKILDIGVELTSITAVKRALRILGEDEELADAIFVAVKDRAFKRVWEQCKADERAIFLPQCLRNSKTCKAELSEFGYVCKRCGGCSINEIIECAEKHGIQHVYIVPGGSMVYKILGRITKNGVKAALGVACMSELREAVEKLSVSGFCVRCVPLRKTGCVDTEVDVEEVKAKIVDGLRIKVE